MTPGSSLCSARDLSIGIKVGFGIMVMTLQVVLHGELS